MDYLRPSPSQPAGAPGRGGRPGVGQFASAGVAAQDQDEGGRIAIPQALHPYLPGLTHIGGE